jgi:hypothetical protein
MNNLDKTSAYQPEDLDSPAVETDAALPGPRRRQTATTRGICRE